MAPCPAQVFENLSQDQLNCLAAKARAAGITISGSGGPTAKKGVTVTWNYDPNTKQLTIQCLSTPPFVSCGSVSSKLHDLVEECTG
jgi:hypothetical protein